jgi:hypothetical protein
MHYHHRNILKQPIYSKFRMCCKAEHIKLIVEGCTTLVPFEYANRHGKVAGYIHWMIYIHTGL